jgi:basic membrane protein A
MVTSAEKRMNLAVYGLIERLIAGEAFSSEDFKGTLANGGQGISPFYDFESRISSEVLSRVKEIEEGIIAGTINPLS